MKIWMQRALAGVAAMLLLAVFATNAEAHPWYGRPRVYYYGPPPGLYGVPVVRQPVVAGPVIAGPVYGPVVAGPIYGVPVRRTWVHRPTYVPIYGSLYQPAWGW